MADAVQSDECDNTNRNTREDKRDEPTPKKLLGLI